jgi:hypothetical protein
MWLAFVDVNSVLSSDEYLITRQVAEGVILICTLLLDQDLNTASKNGQIMAYVELNTSSLTAYNCLTSSERGILLLI